MELMLVMEEKPERMRVTKERPGADAGDSRYSGADIGGGNISWCWWLMGQRKGPEL